MRLPKKFNESVFSRLRPPSVWKFFIGVTMNYRLMVRQNSLGYEADLPGFKAALIYVSAGSEFCIKSAVFTFTVELGHYRRGPCINSCSLRML